MADVFISYATEDRERVKSIADAIESAGFSVWWDRRIGLGSSFDREIERELDAANSVVVVWSRHSIESDWVRAEAQEGLERNVLIPVVLGEAKPPLAFRRTQSAILSEKPTSDELRELLEAIESVESRNRPAHSTRSDQTSPGHVLEGRVKHGLSSLRRPVTLLLIAVAISAGVLYVLWLDNGSAVHSTSPRIASVAVVPFTGIGLEEDSQWLTLGIPSELTAMLSSIPGLRAASQHSSLAYARSGGDPGSSGAPLNVEAVIVGTVQQGENAFRVNVELIRAEDSTVIWREAFTGTRDQTRRVQAEIAAQIFKYFGAQFSRYNFDRPRTEAAYKAHLKRQAYWLTSEGAEELKWAEMTVALEPDYALGYLNTIFPYLYAAINDPYGPWKAKIRTALDTAAELGISETAAFKAHEGLYQWVLEGNIDGAELLLRDSYSEGDEFGRTWYLSLMAASGINEPVLETYERLTLVEPYHPLHWVNLSNQLAYVGDLDRAATAMSRSLELTPGNFFSLENLAVIHCLAGNLGQAKKSLSELREIQNYPPFRLASAEATVATLEGDSESALATAESLSAEGHNFWAAGLFLGGGDNARARQEFEQVVESPQWVKYWVGDWAWRIPSELRESEAFRQFKEDLGYTSGWRLEMCERISYLPARLRISCDPEDQRASL